MANDWFRLYAEFAHDPKVQSLSEPLQRRYIMLLCLKCNGDLKIVTESNDEIALRIVTTALRITAEECIETKKTLIDFSFIDEKWNIHGWEKRQYISDLKDPTNAQRQKRYRDKNSNSNSNATVTAKKRPDTDTDTDKKDTPIIPFPDFIPKELFEELLAIRKKKKAQNTPKAISLLIGKIKSLVDKGYSAQTLIETAIMNSWLTVWEPKESAQQAKKSSWSEGYD